MFRFTFTGLRAALRQLVVEVRKAALPMALAVVAGKFAHVTAEDMRAGFAVWATVELIAFVLTWLTG
ncbi:MAG TPA: hypothetical protein VFQ88_14075 [Nevskiaceae bacterium]|nr:hypothetical protein [Nevskiaceae bacterium]